MKILPFLTVSSLSGKNYNLRDVSSFSYKYSEEEDDVAELTIESPDPEICDHPDFAEGNVLSITWGYSDMGTSEQVTRTVYIFDTKAEYTNECVKLILTCHEKFASAKMDIAKPAKKNNNVGISTIKLQTEVLENIRVKDDYINKFTGVIYSDKNVTSDDISALQKTINSSDYVTNYGRELGSGIFNSRVVQDNSGLTVTIYSGELPTFRGLREFFDKLPGGPYVLDSRDDVLIIRTRDLTQSPVHTYSYLGEPGELLEFTPETKNRSKSKSAEGVKVTGWNSEKKSPIVEISKNEETGQTQKYLWQQLQEEMPTPGSAEWVKSISPKSTAQPGKNVATLPPSLKAAQVHGGLFDPNQWKSQSQIYSEEAQKTIREQLLEGTENMGIGKTLVIGAEKEDNVKGLADNLREEAQLENNPATAKMVGNIHLKSGYVIDIRGVAVRHAGPYYIKECTHRIDSSGYLVTIDKMVRGGLKENTQKAPVKKPTDPVDSINTNDPNKLNSPLDKFNKYHDPTFGIGIVVSPEYNSSGAIDNRLEKLGIFKVDES